MFSFQARSDWTLTTWKNKKPTIYHFKSYCSTVHFCRITSIHQPTNAHIISHKTLLKHSEMLRSCQIIIRVLCSLLKLYYGIHNSILICKRGVVAAYRVVWECVVEQWLGVRRMLSNKRMASLLLLSIRRTPSHCFTTHSHTTRYAATTPRLQIRIELWIP